MSAMDREVEYLEQQLADGVIDAKEFAKQMRELQRDAEAYANECAEQAYDNAMGSF